MNHAEQKERWLNLDQEPLTAREQADAEAHLSACDECRDDVALWQALRNEIVSATPAASPAFVRRVMAQVREAPVPGLWGNFKALWSWWHSAPPLRWAAAGLGTLALAALFYCPRPVSAPSVSLAQLAADYALPFEEDSTESIGTELESYLL